MFDRPPKCTDVYNRADREEHGKNFGTISPYFYQELNCFYRYRPGELPSNEPDSVTETINLKFRGERIIRPYLQLTTEVSHGVLLTSLASIMNRTRFVFSVEEMMDNRIERKLSVLSLMD
jgi:hypothetical protein